MVFKEVFYIFLSICFLPPAPPSDSKSLAYTGQHRCRRRAPVIRGSTIVSCSCDWCTWCPTAGPARPRTGPVTRSGTPRPPGRPVRPVGPRGEPRAGGSSRPAGPVGPECPDAVCRPRRPLPGSRRRAPRRRRRVGADDETTTFSHDDNRRRPAFDAVLTWTVVSRVDFSRVRRLRQRNGLRNRRRTVFVFAYFVIVYRLTILLTRRTATRAHPFER